jgi:hypothetical protein
MHVLLSCVCLVVQSFLPPYHHIPFPENASTDFYVEKNDVCALGGEGTCSPRRPFFL